MSVGADKLSVATDKLSTSEYEQLVERHCATQGFPETWGAVCKELIQTLGETTFEHWFKDIIPAYKPDGSLLLSVKNLFLRDWILEQYTRHLEKAIRGAFSKSQEFTLAVLGHDPAPGPPPVSSVFTRQSSDENAGNKTTASSFSSVTQMS